MEQKKPGVKEVASFSIDDADYAQKVLFGEIDDPVVRDAILADLYESTSIPAGHSEREAKSLFHEKFRDMPSNAGPMGPCFVKYYPKGPKVEMWDEWAEMAKPALARLAERDES